MKNKSMIKMMHRLVSSCGNYKTQIRAAYIPGFFKGLFMKAPLMVCFLIVSAFMAGTVTKKNVPHFRSCAFGMCDFSGGLAEYFGQIAVGCRIQSFC